MAKAAVNLALRRVADPLLKKAHEMYNVSGHIKNMQRDLRLIHALLRHADSKQKTDELVKEWLIQVREIADRIVKVIDIYLVEINENPPQNFHGFTIPCSSKCTKLLTVIRNPLKLYMVSGKLKKITKDLEMIYQRRAALGITVPDSGSEEKRSNRLPPGGQEFPAPRVAAYDFISEENGNGHLRPRYPSDVDDSHVVGLEAHRCQIINELLDGNKKRTVHSIVGTGGLGKTTLAKQIYKSAELEGKFAICKWFSISQKCDINELLKKLLHSIEPETSQQNSCMDYEDVVEKLTKSLNGKRYLIILDDVWTIDIWNQLKIKIPDPENASRVIITTRLEHVAIEADRNTKPHKLPYLNDHDSLALLFKKAFQKDIQPENYPAGLLEVARRLTKKCGGLPLALIVLGSILKVGDDSYPDWCYLEETMDWHEDIGKKCSQVLAMSYEDLPWNLKPCFLYFASFPEDYKISGKHVTKMWIAEGFIPDDGEGTKEDKAKKYLQQLVQRSLVQVTEQSWNGYCKYLSMHDLVRDLAIHQAKEDNFFTIFSKAKEDVNQIATIKPNRAALQLCPLTNDGVHSKETLSLLCFGPHFPGFRDNSNNGSGFSLLNYSGFTLLKVLTIAHVDMRNFPRGGWLKGMKHLKYLGFRYCTIRPDIFVKNSFYNLETIDLKGTKIDRTKDQRFRYCSDVVIRCPTLRHVYGYNRLEEFFPLKWDHLTNLQTIKGVGRSEVPGLGCAINLRTLGISYSINLENEEEHLKGVLTRMEQLVSLRIEMNRRTFTQEVDTLHSTWEKIKGVRGTNFVPFGGTIGLPCHRKIQNLHLQGTWGRHIGVPSVEILPPNITKLTLVYSRLQQDPMPVFESLPSLRVLRLGMFSYDGTELTCSTKGFTKLQKLVLEGLPELQNWHIKEGAMPILSHLKMDWFPKLQALPELQKVPTLQELLLYRPSREVRRRLKTEEELKKIQHIPVRKLRYI